MFPIAALVSAYASSGSLLSLFLAALGISLLVGVAFTIPNAIELTKRLYPGGLEEVMYVEVPLYGMVTKWKSFGGEGKFLDWVYAPGGGGSADFATGQGNKGPSSFARPFIQRKRDYGLASVDRETRLATMGDKYAVASAWSRAIDDCVYNVTRSIGFHLYRDGTGVRATLAAASSGVGTPTITLASTSSLQGLEKNMWVQAVVSGVLQSGRAQITAINRTARTLTTLGNWNAAGNIPGIVDGASLVREGDFNAVCDGLLTWAPTVAPSPGENFKGGVDRGLDPDRLAGLRFAPASGTTQEVLINASAFGADNNGKYNTCMMNPIDFGNLVNQVGAKNVIPVKTDKPNIGYRGLEVWGANGVIQVVPDPCCQLRKFWMMNKEDVEIWSLGDVPQLALDDGDSLTEWNADASELRYAAYLNVVVKNPRNVLNGTLPS